MSIKAVIVGAALLAWVQPAVAQQRGTVEFGAFGSAASFDNALSLKTGYGGGGRIGMYLDPMWIMEFEDAEMRATRPTGLKDVNVGILSGRLVAIPYQSGAFSLLAGAGAGISTETNFLHSYGVDGLIGAKFALTDNASLRVDGVWDWLANQDWKTYKSVRIGLSVFRHASRPMQMAAAPMMPMMMHEDSVSASEIRRLRDRDAALRALRDSLRNLPPAVSKADMETMQAQIQFAFDKSDLTDESRAILDAKLAVFRANPSMSIVMVGYTDVKGTDAYNMALGERRAEVAKQYLVSHGVEASRIILESKGERSQMPNSAGAAGEAENRRAVFRLLIAPTPIANP